MEQIKDNNEIDIIGLVKKYYQNGRFFASLLYALALLD